MKDIILVLFILIAAGLLVAVVRLYQKDDKVSKNWNDEKYSRMVAEETLQKNEAKLSALQESLKDDNDKMAKIQDILDKEKGVNEDLKKQYDTLTEAKAGLEAKLQTVLQEKAAADALQKQAQPSAQPVAQTAQPAGVGH